MKRNIIIVILIIFAYALLGLIAGCKQDTSEVNIKSITYDTVYYFKVIGNDTVYCISSVTMK